MDVLEHLMQEHRQVEQMLTKLSEADEAERAPLIDELADALTVHMAVEERFLYPIVQKVVGEEEEEEAESEHGLARDGMAKLRAMREQPGFGAAVDMLAAGIKHHVHEEEDEIFPKLRQKAAADLKTLEPDELEAEVRSSGSARSGRSNGSAGSAEGATKEELYEQAKEAGIEGRSTMTKTELQDALAKQG
jgi:hemerythrin-like domain-containing protein